MYCFTNLKICYDTGAPKITMNFQKCSSQLPSIQWNKYNKKKRIIECISPFFKGCPARITVIEKY